MKVTVKNLDDRVQIIENHLWPTAKRYPVAMTVRQLSELTGLAKSHVHRMLQNGKWKCQQLTDRHGKTVYLVDAKTFDPLTRLTDRERKVLVLIAQGFTDSTIADLMGCNVTATRALAKDIYAKLGLTRHVGRSHGRAHGPRLKAAMIAHAAGLVPQI